MFFEKTALLPLGLSIILNAVSQVLIKKGVAGAKIEFNIEGLKFLLLNGWVIFGVLAQLFAAYFWFRVLSATDLSVAFPILTSIVFLLVIVASYFLLGEKFSLIQAGGVVLIVLGIFCLSGYVR